MHLEVRKTIFNQHMCKLKGSDHCFAIYDESGIANQFFCNLGQQVIHLDGGVFRAGVVDGYILIDDVVLAEAEAVSLSQAIYWHGGTEFVIQVNNSIDKHATREAA